jgi:molybdate transport system substrate-binding protein
MIRRLQVANAVAGTFCFVLFTAMPNISFSTELKVLAGSGVQPVMTEIIPQFEQTSGQKVTFEYGTVGEMAQRVQRGESLEQQGKVIAGSRADLAKTGIGLFVRKGAPKPDIHSVAAFKRTMLSAKSIGWNDPAAGAPVSLYMIDALERLGIGAEMKPKTVAFKLRSDRFEAIARGDIEIGFNQISEIVAAPGVDLVGPLPPEIQHYTMFTAGVVVSSKDVEAAKELLRFITSPASRAVMAVRGFEVP